MCYNHRDFLQHGPHDKCVVKCHFFGDCPEGQRHSHFSTVNQRHTSCSRANFATMMVKAFMPQSQQNWQHGRRAKISSRGTQGTEHKPLFPCHICTAIKFGVLRKSLEGFQSILKSVRSWSHALSCFYIGKYFYNRPVSWPQDGRPSNHNKVLTVNENVCSSRRSSKRANYWPLTMIGAVTVLCYADAPWDFEFKCICTQMTFRYRASSIQDRRFATLQRTVFIYLINKYISLSDICLTVHHWYK